MDRPNINAQISTIRLNRMRALLAGEKYSSADITLNRDRLREVQQYVNSTDKENLARWHQSVSSRPSAAA
jgi:glutathione S-transferase